MNSFAVVTDSAADMPLELAKKYGIRVVPLHVNIDGRDKRDAYDIRISEFMDVLERGGDLPITSAPAPADFLATYKELVDEGYTQILSIHLSSKLSSTIKTAQGIAGVLPEGLRLEVVDSLSATATLSTMCLEAACIARAGGTIEQAIERVDAIRREAKIYFIPNTLANLVKGGRASKLSGLAASLLDIKVIIEVTGGGRVDMVKKTKGMKSAVKWIAGQMAERSHECGPLVYYELHTRGGHAFDLLEEAVTASGVDGRCLTVGTIGPVIATHVGIGAVGLFCMPAVLHNDVLDEDIATYLTDEY